MKKIFVTVLLAVTGMALHAEIAINQALGWFESGFVTWTTTPGTTYSVAIKSVGGEYQTLDNELVRNYGAYGRADALGLKAGQYQFKVTDANGASTESDVISVKAHDRNGFAHYGRTEGVGAYNNDGTLKPNARVLYVYANNAKTLSLDMQIDSRGTKETRTGLQNIIQAYEKGYETRPLDIRIVGCIKKADMDALGSSAEGLQVKGKGGSIAANLTIEGVGNDATIHGFGILCRSIGSVEFRNFAVMICMDDCLSLDTDNKNIWIHNMDFFYGGTGSDADQAKGDGTVDIKGKSSHVTVAYNHFYDSGKCSLGGMKSETTDCWMTYHHNWFDHSDSRHPRIRTAFYHIYNNYFDGNSKYGVGVTMGGSAFVESNHFRNCKYPMLISKQGTDAEGDGTFSGEAGGVIKAYGNIVLHPRKLQYYDGSQTDGKWDAVKSESREAEVSATAFSGATGYNNAATSAAILAVPATAIDDPEQIPAIVRGSLGAGRIGHGDFTWSFKNSVQDANYNVISELKTALLNYCSTLVGFFSGTTSISNGGATTTVDGGDGKGIDQATNDAYVPEWAGGSGNDSGNDNNYVGATVLGTADDFFWFNASNAEVVNNCYSTGLFSGGNFVPSHVVSSSSGESYSDYTGSIRLSSGAAMTFHLEEGIGMLSLYVSGNGSMSWQLSSSTDGNNYSDEGGPITGNKGTHPSVVFTASSDDIKYVRITNKASGNRDLQGIKLFVADSEQSLEAIGSTCNDGPSLYDLQGRLVRRPQHGQLYIRNGKKIFY